MWLKSLRCWSAVALLSVSWLVVHPQVAKVTVRIIVIETQQKAEHVLGELKAGADFATVAKAESVDPTAADGGLLGDVSPDGLRSELREAIQGLRPGQFSGIAHIPSGYAILQIEKSDSRTSEDADALREKSVNDRPVGMDAVSQPLSEQAIVKLPPDTSGLIDVEGAFQTVTKPEGWNRDMATVCRIHDGPLIPILEDNVQKLLHSPDAENLSAMEKMQYHYAAAVLASYKGNMDLAIEEWTNCNSIIQSGLPDAVPMIQEVLGSAYLHRAEMKNGIYDEPGDRCILPPKNPHEHFADSSDSKMAIEYFLQYLKNKPDDLEVKWLLNVAYLTLGQYPSGVPAQYRITAPAQSDPAESIGRFEDVAPAAGLALKQIAGGMLVEDLENNGLLDVLTSGYDSCDHLHYFHNNGDGTFSDWSDRSGLSQIPAGENFIQADFNNDGCIDILILRGGWQNPFPLSLLRNNCDGTFTDVAKQAGLGDLFATQTAVWADIDNDGWVDLFVGNEKGPSQLYRNKGDGTFENISSSAGVDRSAFTKAVVSADYDGDGYPDFFVSNMSGGNFLYHNNGNNTFTEVAAKAGVEASWAGFAAWFFDYDNDGWPDLFVTSDYSSIDETMRTYLKLPHNGRPLRLYKNMRNGTFQDVTAKVGLDKVYMPMGANYGDVDNDGFLDIYLGTGSAEYASLVPNVLLRNKAGKTWVDITASSGTGELHKTHGISFADLENRGHQDIVVEMGGAVPSDAHPVRVFRNPGNANHWINVRLRGVKSNRSAFGAKIKVVAENRDHTVQAFYRQVDSGGSWGASPLAQEIGLGKAVAIKSIEIYWPASKTIQAFKNVPMDEFIDIEESKAQFTKRELPTYRLGAKTALPTLRASQ
ncbi:FG-GAP-like repeat-containing protein [Silvibacterium bohemicum]|uniref:FG-GAP-like repeat-containing protein n=1 Tax=Silvibacterium bohemicum TaxID=1577686 RepID=UPI0009E3FC7C|nr:FG-GAP-like repeat-containing protein [Silvibacterium bohemicum]